MSKFTAQSLVVKPLVFDSLLSALDGVPDNRGDQGKRYPLSLLIGLPLLGFIKGKTSLEACVMFGEARERWLVKWFDLGHGIPCATTISRALAVTSPQDVIRAVNQFIRSVEGIVIEAGVSIDGKTVKAISELKRGVKHFITLFTHNSCRVLDQEGVSRKENEITATPRMLERHCLLGSMVTADALLTQTRITQAIRGSMADYLLIVKGNHPELQNIFEPTFNDPLTQANKQTFKENRRTRSIKTTIALTTDVDLDELQKQGWRDIAIVGKLERKGWRITKRTKTRINETIYFISSRATLIPRQTYRLIRDHWHVENKLHWQKDVTLKEDRQRTKTGNAPSILSYLRSLAIQFIRQEYHSVTQAIEDFTERPNTYTKLLIQQKIV